jgi:hypothetical protein
MGILPDHSDCVASPAPQVNDAEPRFSGPTSLPGLLPRRRAAEGQPPNRCGVATGVVVLSIRERLRRTLRITADQMR